VPEKDADEIDLVDANSVYEAYMDQLDLWLDEQRYVQEETQGLVS